MPRIHPTAIVDGGARLAEDVVVGAFCLVEDDVEIGPGTELRPHAVILSHTRLGAGNLVDSHAVLGGLPQDLKFDPATVSYLRIGDYNVFREQVTISRGSKPGTATTIGSHTYWMANSHAGHDVTVEDRVILTNNAGLGGHSTVHSRAIFGGGAFLHQFTWVGEMAMIRGLGGASTHVPPYTMVAEINNLVGLNSIGLRRAPDMTDEDRRQIKQAFCLTYRAGKTPAQALAEMDGWGDIRPAAARFREFIRKVLAAERPYKRGLCAMRGRPHKQRMGPDAVGEGGD